MAKIPTLKTGIAGSAAPSPPSRGNYILDTTSAIGRMVDKPYTELGSIDGIARGVDIDGYGRRLLYVRHRITGDVVKCILQGRALEMIGQHTVGDVFKGMRVRVQGTIRYRSLGHITQVEATDIVFATPRTDLPTVDDILDENFTGGLTSEDYLERLRDGRLS